jgi:hypothetical protein
MIKLRITKASGDVQTYAITPVIEYAFENYAKVGFMKAFRENEKQTDVYWLAWECLRRNGETVPLFGEKFIETLELVEVLVDDSPNG